VHEVGEERREEVKPGKIQNERSRYKPEPMDWGKTIKVIEMKKNRGVVFFRQRDQQEKRGFHKEVKAVNTLMKVQENGQ